MFSRRPSSAVCRLLFTFLRVATTTSENINVWLKMPELKRTLDDADSTALVVAKKPRNELVEVTDKSKAVVEAVSNFYPQL